VKRAREDFSQKRLVQYSKRWMIAGPYYTDNGTKQIIPFGGWNGRMV
jgi:hypothetical protein